MNKENFPQCPICLQKITSDAALTRYCKLCGMGIEEQSQDFCCIDCKAKLIRIRM